MTLGVIRQEREGVEYFSLEATGESGMSLSGLARLCGVEQKAIHKLLSSLKSVRIKQLPESLKPFAEKEIQFWANVASQNTVIIRDEVCAAVIEYYAFDSHSSTPSALKVYRSFASRGVRAWIQSITGWKRQPSEPMNPVQLPPSLLKLVARIERRGEELHTAHHRLMTDIRELVQVIRTTYNRSAHEEYQSLLTKLATQLEKALAQQDALESIAVPPRPELIEQAFINNSKQIGCLYRYTSKRRNKAGELIEYPTIEGVRDESIDEHWFWGYKYAVKDPVTGKWRKPSRSVKLEKLPAVRTAIALDAHLHSILALLGSHSSNRD
jgi:hypothetical protein